MKACCMALIPEIELFTNDATAELVVTFFYFSRVQRILTALNRISL